MPKVRLMCHMCHDNSYADRNTKFFTKPHLDVIRVACYSTRTPGL